MAIKIAVITRHAITNYGSLLQSLATQCVLEKMGHSCQIIDYIREDESLWQMERSILKRKPEWNGNLLKRLVYLTLRYIPAVIPAVAFEKERRHYLKLTQRYSSLKELIDGKPEADVYMSGSDQLWGPVVDGSHDSAYCLSFTDEADRRVAYAASFGASELPEEVQLHYRKWLSRYETITVREQQAVGILENIQISAHQVLDPTLLVTGNEWLEMMKVCPKKGKYILVYQLHSNPRLDAYAKKVAQEKKLPLYRVSVSLHQMSRAGRLIWMPKAKQFLSYLSGAECLITDSFHGTAFAINLGVPFVNVYSSNGTQSRITSILDSFGLSERILTDENDIALANRPVDYARVHAIIEQKRQASFQILEQMLGKD